eukprot:m.51615 g.51615  ORF g.51615 m.51615 type:complete len:422 (-) comp7572_c0_seq2:957-2222(-)
MSGETITTVTSEDGGEKATSPLLSTTPCILCIGMAGSGKSSLVQRINSYLHQRKLASSKEEGKTGEKEEDGEKVGEKEDTSSEKDEEDSKADDKEGASEEDSFDTPCYLINLDPAVYQLPFEANIDIRETVDYKSVMKNYGLGPNGGIVTSLNLFATKFDEVLDIMEKRSATSDYFLFDTPGQIEVFTWSASGAIITETLASSFPTVVLYIIDTPRCISPVSFMSNMLYACSILYKTRLPFVLVFNKVDISGSDFAMEWLRDYDSFRDALQEETAYIGTMARSMALVLEEFYQNLRAVGVSALTGSGMDELFVAVDEAINEYMEEYKPEIDEMFLAKQREKEKAANKSLEELAEDLRIGGEKVTPQSSTYISVGDDDSSNTMVSNGKDAISTTSPSTKVMQAAEEIALEYDSDDVEEEMDN